MLEDLWLKNYFLHTNHFSISHPCLLRRERSSNVIGCHFSESLKKATAPNTQIKWLVFPSAIGELGPFTQPQSKVDQVSGEISYLYLPYVVISSMYRLQLVPHNFWPFSVAEHLRKSFSSCHFYCYIVLNLCLRLL